MLTHQPTRGLTACPAAYAPRPAQPYILTRSLGLPLGLPGLSLTGLGLRGRAQAALGLDEADDAIEPLALLQVGHHERPLAPHPFRIKLHLLQRRPDRRPEVA